MNRGETGMKENRGSRTALAAVIGAVILAILVFLALVCYGFQMLRLFFKI